MTQDQKKTPITPTIAGNYYGVLGISPAASVIEVRRAYRELSKRYHPDTTELPAAEANAQFQRLNEAYSTLSHPERRSLYDLKIGYSRYHGLQPWSDSANDQSAYLAQGDRPLSSGEIFALFILALTLMACLLLALIVAMLRGDPLTIP